ncbi:MAG: glycosyltransferase, partial [Burkholderiales bacterium]|nr:glycosyltransferase [Burkholderiales bacterium]
QIAMGSLPQYLRRSLADFPRHRGYLKADPERVQVWHERLAALGPGLKVGISWQGGTHKTRRPMRSIPLAQWAPLLQSAGVQYVSLQYTECSGEIAAVEAATGVRIADWREVRDDLEHTAALITALDLVISVCTAVIHLGGALGKPVWVLAPYSPEWRYGIAGDGMPWYPSVKMFRQLRYGEWQPVIERVAHQFHAAAQRNGVNETPG